MLYNFNWLQPGKPFPPTSEVSRIVRYQQNAMLFDGDHFADPAFRVRNESGVLPVSVYAKCAERISQVIGNFEDVISFPTLLNYQRLMSLKMADLVCGERPTISGAGMDENERIREVREYSDFDAQVYSTVIDISRYGDAIWRMYRDFENRDTFTCWNPTQWFPVVAQDGTNSVKAHCLCWRENKSEDPINPDWYLNVQIHWNQGEKVGKYEQQLYRMTQDGGTILDLVSTETKNTGFDRCAIFHIRAFATTNSVYGYDDYMPIDSILAEIMARVGQISVILDKHADPNITGPVSMLAVDPVTGEYTLSGGKFFATSPGENKPEYMTWDGQLASAFKQLEFLINQMYILSEMGAALLGSQEGSVTAVSGSAMRFKLVNPLAKARRIANSLTRVVSQLFSSLSKTTENPVSGQRYAEAIPSCNISVFWADGLPDDPRENIENAKLATGVTKMMPLDTAIMEFFGRSNDEALQWIKKLREEEDRNRALNNPIEDPNKPGPQDGTGVNPQKKGSETGLNDFRGLTAK